jgi:hypothetical protein
VAEKAVLPFRIQFAVKIQGKISRAIAFRFLFFPVVTVEKWAESLEFGESARAGLAFPQVEEKLSCRLIT